MAKVKKSGKGFKVVHATNGTTISRHKTRGAAIKKRDKLHRELGMTKRRKKKRKRRKGGF